jgi:UPF0755 protein
MKRRWLIGVVVVLAMILIAGIAIVGSNVYRLLYIAMMGGQTKPMIMTIDKSSSASSFADRLFAKHLIPNKRWFIVLIRMQGLSQQLKAGIYELQPGETAQHFLQRVVAGDVMAQSFSIIDGTRQAQVVTKLQSAPYLTNDPDVWPLIAKPYLSAEGLLLADTYFYDAGSHSKDLLMHAHNQLLQYLEVSWQQRSPGLPYKNSYELLIAASILEKETAIPQEKRLIAGVIINRLRQKMLLQMDPTVIYALGTNFKGKITKADLQIDSPYNTYRYRGLPPTPIAMVGKDAIDAAAHPQFSNYLYFVAKADGGHYFSVSYDEQKQAVQRYLGTK